MTTGEIVILSVLGLIIYKLFNMPTKAEFDAAIADMQTGLNNVADDITRLTEQIGAGGMTDAEEAAALADLQAVAQRIRDIAAVTPEAPTTEG
jgi:hypothetical protein